MNLQLGLGVAANPRTWPIIDERIKPKDVPQTCKSANSLAFTVASSGP